VVVSLSFCLFLFFSIICCLYVICGVLHTRVGERSYNFQINQKHFSTVTSRIGNGIVTGQVLPDQNLTAILYKLSEANGNNFKLKPQFINTLPKFHGSESEDAYFFVREFKEVYLMMRILQLGDDTVRLRFIFFSLKDLDKK